MKSEIESIVAKTKRHFGSRITAIIATRPDEIYFHAPLDLVAGLSGHLYKKWNARFVSIFADDVREQEKAFHLYYVYAL
ncbi:MAG TPA: hypothetical protein VN516_01420, partial [Candidatus Baltobacteraceae bacterium]|nr:hypothetical protein [Candidatus Baltobacteraceae bacterium]